MPSAVVDEGVDIYYEEFGSGSPILFINAGLATHDEWEHQVAALAPAHRTITFDWRGTGLSAKPNSPYTLDALVSDTVALSRHLSIQGATVVAHGIGCHAALVLAERHPQLVEKLVLTGAAPWYGGDVDGQAGGLAPEFSTWWAEQISSDSAPVVEAYAALGREYLFQRPPSDELLTSFVAGALSWPLYVFNAYCADMAGLDHRSRLPTIAAPVLVIQGRHDRKQRYEGARIVADLVPNGTLLTFENSAHMPNMEEIAEFNRQVRAFVTNRPE